MTEVLAVDIERYRSLVRAASRRLDLMPAMSPEMDLYRLAPCVVKVNGVLWVTMNFLTRAVDL